MDAENNENILLREIAQLRASMATVAKENSDLRKAMEGTATLTKNPSSLIDTAAVVSMTGNTRYVCSR